MMFRKIQMLRLSKTETQTFHLVRLQLLDQLAIHFHCRCFLLVPFVIQHKFRTNHLLCLWMFLLDFVMLKHTGCVNGLSIHMDDDANRNKKLGYKGQVLRCYHAPLGRRKVRRGG